MPKVFTGAAHAVVVVMTWTKLGDEFADECWQLPDDAWRLHVEGLIWSNSKHTDGRLLKDEMRRWAKNPDAAETLVDRGWWEDGGDHYQVIHHQRAQRTAAEWRAQSAANSRNGRRGGRPKKVRPESESQTESQSESKSETESKRDRTGQDRTGMEKGGTSLRLAFGTVCVICSKREAQEGSDVCGPCVVYRARKRAGLA